jgi:hypothetical protein
VKQLFFIALLAVSAACNKTDPGGGSGTLATLVEINGRTDHTTVEVSIQLRGAPVAGANVVVTDDDTDIATTLESRSAGIYKATLDGWVRTIAIQITSGEDELDARLEGPAPHRITRPPNDARVIRGDFEVLRIEWEAEDPAERVEVEPEGTAAIALEGDPFAAEIPLRMLANGDQRIGVTRETAVDLDGGTEGSRMRSRYKVDNRFTLE